MQVPRSDPVASNTDLEELRGPSLEGKTDRTLPLVRRKTSVLLPMISRLEPPRIYDNSGGGPMVRIRSSTAIGCRTVEAVACPAHCDSAARDRSWQVGSISSPIEPWRRWPRSLFVPPLVFVRYCRPRLKAHRSPIRVLRPSVIAMIREWRRRTNESIRADDRRIEQGPDDLVQSSEPPAITSRY